MTIASRSHTSCSRLFCSRLFTVGAIAAAALLGMLALPGAASASEIKVLATTNMMPILEALTGPFESASGHKLKFDHGGANPIKNRIQAGEFADVAMHSRPTLDGLMQQGKIRAGSITDVARIPVGLAVRAGSPKPAIGSADALKRALLAAGSIAYPDPAGGSLGGIYFAGLIEQLGIAAEIKLKARLTGPATAAAELVANGGAEIVVDQLAQLQQVAGLDLVLLPAELMAKIVMAAAVSSAAREPEAATAYIKFLTSPAAALAITAKGMEP